MKFYKMGIILLFLLVLSAGAVCASDVDNADVGLSDNDQLSGGEKTYTDLNNLINSSTSSTIEIMDDYKFNKQTDNITCIIFNDTTKEYIFEGNNHEIDGSGSASLFRFFGVNATLKNLVIKNCNQSPIIAKDCYLTTINLTFINNSNSNSGGAIITKNSTVVSNGDNFIDNYALEGASLYLIESKFEAVDDVFVSSIPVGWAMIYGSAGDISIENCVFANTTSKYATAIYNDYRTSIKKSKFIDLMANLTAGAIAIKTCDADGSETVIEDCDFIRVSSAKNAGAIFADIASDDEYDGNVLITNTNFVECKSMFGAAILQLAGNLTIISSNFDSNYAYISGGAIYTSYTSVDINDCNFTNNTADWQGGALYLDASSLYSQNNNFISNSAYQCGGIYLYQSYYEITKSNFEDNGDAIWSFFDDEGSYQKNNNFARDKVVLNQDYYATYVDFEGKQIVLNPLKIEGSPSDSYFNLAKQGLVTPVKNQGFNGACWAFGTAGALESAFLIATNITLDISENNIQGACLRYSPYGGTDMTEAGTYNMGAGYFLGWLGVVSTKYDEYDELGKITPIIFEDNAYHIVDAIFVNMSDSSALKKALTKYGAFNLFVYGADNQNKYYNPETHASYYNGNISANHYVTLVGWDDNFSASNFISTPPGDGAWICKNSWGTEWGEDGYFYLSYYDNALKLGYDAVGFIINNTQLYNKLYQYDVTGFTMYHDNIYGDYCEYMNKFISGGNDLIAAVGTYFQNNDSDYTITIYVNGTEVYSQEGKSQFSGFNTIKLNQFVSIFEDDDFSIKIKSKSIPLLQNSRINIGEGVSFGNDGNGMEDLYNYGLIASVKAYTIENTLHMDNIKQPYTPSRTFIAYSELEGSSLTLKQNGKIVASAVVKNGIADFGVILKPGVYALSNPYNGSVIITTVEILNSIIVDKEITMAYNSGYRLPVTFVDDCGNLLKYTQVTYRFDDDNDIEAETDDEGILTIVIYKDSPIGTYKLTFTNPITDEAFTTTINIVSRIAGNSNINMFYYDGTTYRVKILADDGESVAAGESVTITIGKNSYIVRSDDNGIATLKIPSAIMPGTYKITATFAGQTVKNTIKVKHVLKSAKTVTVKKSAKKLVLTAVLKGKTVLKNKVVKFKVNGKTYQAKTNSKGIAKLTIKKSAINKLKAGKKYVVKIAYGKDVIKTTLKVKR